MKIGKTIASNEFPNTIDNFWFALKPNMIVNPFDYVAVKNVRNTERIGMVQYLRTFVADSNGIGSKRRSNARSGIIARAVVMATTTTTTANPSKTNSDHPINLPVGFEKPVRFASTEEIKIALGIPNMDRSPLE